MTKYTYIVQDEKVEIIERGIVLPSKAIQLARAHGLKGKLEIHHVLARLNQDEKTLVIYFIDNNDKIIGEVYPNMP